MKKIEVKGVTYTKEVIQGLLRTDVKWIERSVVILYGFQTEEEQQSEDTIEMNGQGFNGRDGQILTSFGKQLTMGRHLSVKQLDICKKLLPKYWGQILNVIIEKNS